jgi:ATP-binding cassette subfamily B protein
VFDEATSSLDSQSEKLILSALEKISRDKTTLVIAHRLSTIVDADTIVVMDEGRVKEQGNHQELMSRGGIYADLWAIQQRKAEKRQLLEQDSDQVSVQ